MSSRVTSTRFVGRAAELGELRGALGQAAAGAPSLAFVAGESGLGKTRLLSELARAARADGVRVLSGDCVELGEGELPYAPLVGALRPLARNGDPILQQLSPESREALGQLLPGLSDGRRSSEFVQSRVFEGLLELLDKLGESGGLLLQIEDLHWADRSTRAFLVYLARSLCTEHVLVVASYRPDELHRRHPLRPLLAELERDARALRVELKPLTRDELAEQLCDILGEPPAPELVSRLLMRCEGNPLFAEELLAAGIDGRGALPPTLRDALMLRIERLGPEAQELLRLLAAGRRLDHATLADASGMDPRVLREAARETVAAQLVVADEEGRYQFRHALLREVVADDLLPGERAELHLALARALERRADGLPDHGGAHLAAGIAHHYLAAGDQPAALQASVRAAQAAANVYADGEAAALYSRALQLWDRVTDADRLAGMDHVALLMAAAISRAREHEPSRAEMLLRGALQELSAETDPLRAAAVYGALARQQFSQGRSREATESRERSLELMPTEPSPLRAEILTDSAKELMLESRFYEALEASRESLEIARTVGDVRSEIRSLEGMGLSLYGLARYEEGEEPLRQALSLAKDSGRLEMVAHVQVNLGDALYQAGRLPEALELVAGGVAYQREQGRRNRWLQLLYVELSFEAGDWATSEAALPMPGRPSMGTTYLNEAIRRVELFLGRGDHERARALLDQAEDIAVDTREPQWIGPLGSLRAELERRTGDLEAARAAIDNALDRLDFCSDDVNRMARVAATGVRVEADAAVRARDLGDDPSFALANGAGLVMRVEACAEGVRPVERAFLLSAQAEELRAAGSDDPARWAAAAEAWDGLARPYRAAQARRRRAESLLAGGDREAAAAEAVSALDAARTIGANWLVSELEGFGLRARLRLDAEPEEVAPAASDDPDPFGLTPRERQVLSLVAAGRTNREIGAELYMAEKTASVHVSRILAKLDVRSRTEAAALAHRVGLV